MRGALERGVLARLAALDFAEMIGILLEAITRHNRNHGIPDDLLGWLDARVAEPAALVVICETIRGELPTLFRFFLAEACPLQKLVHASQAPLTQVRFDPVNPLPIRCAPSSTA